jgi:uncharacterized iron-regulated membrane protein
MAKLSNRTWFKLHGWFSLPVWFLFCFVCFTGTLAVVSHELTWLTNSNARAENPNHLPEKNDAELVDIVQSAYPTAKVSTVLSFEPYLVNAVILTDSDKPYAIAYVNQYTGEIQEVNQGVTFINFIRSLHGWLLFPWHVNYSVGYYIVCLMAVVMLGALVTGLVVYKKFWRALIAPKIRFNQGTKTLLTDLHKVTGVWSMWFLLLMSATGLWYLIQAIIWHNDIDIEPHIPIISSTQLPSNVDTAPEFPISLQNALVIAKQQYSDFSATYVMTPEHHRDTYKLYGKGDFIFFDDFSYMVAVNPWDGSVEYQRGPDNMTVLQTIEHVADPLHYGNIGGIWTKIIWFVFGIGLTVMSITGFMMWSKRNKKVLKRVESTIGEEASNQTVIIGGAK